MVRGCGFQKVFVEDELHKVLQGCEHVGSQGFLGFANGPS